MDALMMFLEDPFLL